MVPECMSLMGMWLAMWLALGTGFGPVAGASEIPPEFNYVGSYRLVKRVKVRAGKPLAIAIPALEYRVYTDGISLRFYGADPDGGFTSFEVYRTDGIMRMRDESLLEAVPGVQARSMVGQVLRQVTLTADNLTLTKFPALCDAVEITYADRIPEEKNNGRNAEMNVQVEP